MNRPNLISLTTDFGMEDPFVGIMKGVMLKIHPSIQFADLTHSIDPQNIRKAALVVWASSGYFPKGTVHLAVVDPGVGSSRRPIGIETEDGFFVGPDNGIFSLAVKEKTVLQVVELTNPKYFLSPVSSTFHGRDIFAPVAAHLAIGVPLADFGEPVETIQELKLFLPFLEGMTLKAEVLYIDRFGNAITNVSREILETMQTELQTEQMEVRIKETRIRGIAGSYRDILQGEEVSSASHKNPLGIICNSLNLLEFFVYRGNAQTEYEIEVGVPVEILFL